MCTRSTASKLEQVANLCVLKPTQLSIHRTKTILSASLHAASSIQMSASEGNR